MASPQGGVVYNKAHTVTKHDTLNLEYFEQLARLTDAIFIGTGGTITVVFGDNSIQTFTAATGTILPVAAKRVNSTDTAAALMVALYVV